MQSPMNRVRDLTRVAAPVALGAVGAVGALVAVATLALPARAQEDTFALAAAVPGDVFLMTETRYDAAREFLDEYWADVWDAFHESGVAGEALDLVLAMAGEEHAEELNRIRERFAGLVRATDWAGIGSGEVAFAERLPAPVFVDGAVNLIGQPELVLISRTDEESAGAHYGALRAILAAMIDEINRASGMELELAEAEQGALTSTVFELAQVHPGAPDLSFSLLHQGDVVAFTFGITIGDEVAALLAGTSESPSVADSRRYRNALASLPSAENGYEFVDLRNLQTSLQKLLDGILDKVSEAAREESSDTPDSVNSVAWLDGVRAVADRLIGILGAFEYSATVHSTDGYSVHDHSITVLAEGAKKNPVYPVLVGGEPVENFARYLPEETVSFEVSGSFDPGALYTFLEGTVSAAGEPGEQVLAMWNAFQEERGFSVRDDVLGWIDGAGVSASFRDGDSDAWISLMKVKDEEVAREKVSWALAALPEMLAELTALNPMLGMLAMTVQPTSTEGLEGFSDVSIGMLAQGLAVGVHDGWLVIGSSGSAVLLCQATAAGEHANVLANERLMSRALVPEGPTHLVSFADHRGDAKQSGAILRGVAMMGGMVSASIPDPKAQKAIGAVCGIVAKLAPVVEAIDFYDSSATVTTFDGKAWHSRSVTHYVPPTKPEAKPETETETGAER